MRARWLCVVILVAVVTVAATPAAADPVELNITASSEDPGSLGATGLPSAVHEKYDNPHQQTTLTVGVNYTDDGIVDQSDQIKAAFDYWEANSMEYSGYPIVYEFEPDETDPDVILEFTNNISVCGSTWNPRTIGCAPVVTSPYFGPLEVSIKSSYDPAATEWILKHELGHTLGLEHGDDPEDIMEDTLPRDLAHARIVAERQPSDFGRVRSQRV